MTLKPLIGIAGRKYHGKDSAAEALPYYFRNVKFAEPLKEMVYGLLRVQGVHQNTVKAMIEGKKKETKTEYLNGKTPRFVMQTIGTEWGRNIMGEDTWVNIFKNRVNYFREYRGVAVVCTDMRFPNECDAIRAMGGFTVRVVRPNAPLTAGHDHPSEAAIDSLQTDVVIMNDGTLEDLHTAVRNAVRLYCKDHGVVVQQ